MTLPTEAQWERAARAGTSWPWYTGDRQESLQGYENLADATAKEQKAFDKHNDALRDGFVLCAPVGSFNANPFGLHDVLGNVCEVCLDPLTSYSEPWRAGDGYRPGGREGWHVRRGGCFEDVSEVRVAPRRRTPAESGGAAIGYRVARTLRSAR
jgi:formylglycine-generating enzyme required for sulfatase activity